MFKTNSLIRILVVTASLLMLAVTIFYPFGPDQLGFSIGGELIRHGSVQWRDFMDTKPPLIFYIYAAASFIFGHHEWSIRLFDALYHIGSLLYLYIVFRRTLRSETVAFGAVVIYAGLYAVNGFTTLAQTESFALLPMIVLYDMTERSASGERPMRNGLIAGVASTALLLLKLTLVVAPIASVIYLLFFSSSTDRKTTSRFCVGAVGGFFLSLAVAGLYFWSVGATDHIWEWLMWVREYSKIADQTLQEGLYRIFPMGLIVAFGFTTLMIGTIGGYVLSTDRNLPKTYAHLILQFAIGCIAILIERKFFPYHYLRLYWCAVPFIALGVIELYQLWKRTMATYTSGANNRVRQLLFIAALIAVIFYSNVPRIMTQPIHWVSMKLSGKDYAKDMEDHFWRTYYKEQMIVADSLRPLLASEDKVFIWGHDAAAYFWLDRYPKKFGLPNAAYVTAWAPPQWKQELFDSLRNTPPRFFISEFGDIRTYITGDTLDSWAYLKRWSELDSFIHQQYSERQTIGHFKIFERK